MVRIAAEDEKLLRVRWEKARRDPVEFLRHFVFTLDQHDMDCPVKAFPVDERPHTLWVARIWHMLWGRKLRVLNPVTGREQLCQGLVMAKSRQVLQTWEFTALCLWDVLFHGGRLVFMQSKREEDAIGDECGGTGLLGRVKFMLHHVPGGKLLLPRYEERANRLEFPDQRSVLWAIPEGGSIIRTHTASGIFSDECAFQPEFEDAYVSAMPCLRGGGWFAAVSTPDPGFFQELYEDRRGQAA